MKKITLTGRQIKFIINFISLAIFAFSYFYVYSYYVQKTEAAHKERDAIKLEIAQRDKMLSEEAIVQETTDEVKEQTLEIMEAYPVYIAKEDNVIFIEKLQKDLKLQLTSMNVGDSVAIMDTELPARSGDEVDNSKVSTTESEALVESEISKKTETSEASDTIKGMQTNISLSFISTMNGFKEFVDYIRVYPEQTSIESAAISYDSSTGNLACNVVIKRYYLTGTGKVYEPPYINDISIGTDNIFGTAPDIKPEVTEEQLTTP